MHRTNSGKRIELSARDIELFTALARYRYLRSTYLHAFVGGASETRFKERLGALYHDGRYLDRPATQWESAGARCAPVVYELDVRGEEVLRERGMYDGAGRRCTGTNHHFHHTLMICEAVASIELATRDRPGVRFVPLLEILRRRPEGASLRFPARVSYTSPQGKSMSADFGLVPDALFGIEYAKEDGGKTYRFFALEVERRNRVDCGNLSQTSWLKKVLGYRDVVARKTYESVLGLPNLMVMAVAPSQRHIDNMKALVMDVTGGRGSSLFLFKAVSELSAGRPVTELFTGVWERVGREGFSIA